MLMSPIKSLLCLAATLAVLPAAVGSAAEAATPPAPAATAAPVGTLPANLRIAIIDTERILATSQIGKKALGELKKLQETKEGELRARAQEIKDLQDKIQSGKLSLAEEKLAEIGKQIEDKEILLRRMQDDAARDFNKKKEELLGGIEEKVVPVITKAGKELGYTLIFKKFESGLIYADEAVDITTEIVQRLDAAQPVK
jgi:outer membrane protein